MAMDSSLDRVYIEYLEVSNIKEVEQVHKVDNEPSWMDHFVKYLTDDTILGNTS